MNKIGEANKDFLARVSDLMEEEERKRQDYGGASAQRCQGHRHQRLHQDQDSLWARLFLPPDGRSNVDNHKLDRQWRVRFAWGTDACLCLPQFGWRPEDPLSSNQLAGKTTLIFLDSKGSAV